MAVGNPMHVINSRDTEVISLGSKASVPYAPLTTLLRILQSTRRYIHSYCSSQRMFPYSDEFNHVAAMLWLVTKRQDSHRVTDCL
jgi:hypothetical protein